jgi:hypothetical protein
MDSTPFSIEKVAGSWGGNMVQALVPLDAMGPGGFSMKVFPKSHRWFKADAYSSREFCDFYEDVEADLLRHHQHHQHHQFGTGAVEEVEIQLNPGDMLLHHGGLFHTVSSSRACTLQSCRRIQISWFDAGATRWRQDVAPKPWPFISSEYKADILKADMQPPGVSSGGTKGYPRVAKLNAASSVTTTPKHDEDRQDAYVVFPGRFAGDAVGEMKHDIIGDAAPLIPALSEWIAFVFHALRHGFNPKNDVANTCPHKM